MSQDTLPNPNEAVSLFKVLLELAGQYRHRRLLVISGSHEWCEALARQCLASVAAQGKKVLWVGEGDDAVSTSRCKHYLGTECDLLIYDAFAGLNANALSAISGTLVGGGVMLLLTPALQDWPGFADPDYQRFLAYPHSAVDSSQFFLSRLVQGLKACRHACLVQQGQPLPAEPPIEYEVANLQPRPEAPFLSDDQQQAVAAISKVVTGHRRRPLVIQADRGRGKSAALGLAAAQLLSAKPLHIVVTAPNRAAVDSVFSIAAEQLGHQRFSGNQLISGDGSLRFMAVDELLHSDNRVDLLLVDEAAALPVELLLQLLTRFSRLVFSTTLYGYEGSGRGFELRFKPLLHTHSPQWRQLEMKTPIRWRQGDPLENWLFDSFLLSAKPETIAADLQLQSCSLQEICQGELRADENKLHDLVGLLVLAHYQTTPNDYRQLLDSPGLRIFIAYASGKLVGVILAIEEGLFPAPVAEQISQGQRRPKGHLLAQTLAAQQGYQQAATMAGLRIMRIAVHPQLQGQGLGSSMLTDLSTLLAGSHYDWLGASFGASATLVRFWQRAGYDCLRLGFQRDASSGSYSAIMMKALSPQGCDFVDSAGQRFLQQFPVYLGSAFQNLEPALVCQLLAGYPQSALSQLDQRDVEAFGQQFRGYEACLPALRQFTLNAIASGLTVRCGADACALLVRRILQGGAVAEIVAALDDVAGIAITGRKGLDQALATIVNELSVAQAGIIPHNC
jgi:tRNA(Met) cytidine acetyltransferase